MRSAGVEMGAVFLQCLFCGNGLLFEAAYMKDYSWEDGVFLFYLYARTDMIKA